MQDQNCHTHILDIYKHMLDIYLSLSNKQTCSDTDMHARKVIYTQIHRYTAFLKRSSRIAIYSIY